MMRASSLPKSRERQVAKAVRPNSLTMKMAMTVRFVWKD